MERVGQFMRSMPNPSTFLSSKDQRDIGDYAVWSASTAKPGNGVELLRDGRSDTYWQSDGVQPHLVSRPQGQPATDAPTSQQLIQRSKNVFAVVPKS